MSGGFDLAALNNQNIKSFEQEDAAISGEHIKAGTYEFFIYLTSSFSSCQMEIS
jgi:hypothetical protein